MQKKEQGSVIEENIRKRLTESSKGGIFIKEKLLFDNFTPTSDCSKKESHPNVIFVMMVDVTIEAVMAKMERKVDLLMKAVEERDHEIATLKDQMQARETADSSQTLIVKANGKGKTLLQGSRLQQSTSVAPLTIQ